MMQPLRKMRRFVDPKPATPMLEEIPPHDAKAESAVLGAMIIDARAFAVALDSVQADDFYIDRNRTLFIELATMQPPLDELLVRNELKRRRKLDEIGGVDALSFIIEQTPNASSVESYCLEVKRLSNSRRARAAAIRLYQDAETGDDQTAIRQAIADLIPLETPPAETGNAVDALFDQIEQEFTGLRSALTLPYLFNLLSTKCFLPGTITIMCGTAGASKSLFVLEMIWRFFESGISVAKLELESGVPFHLRRAIAQMSNNSGVTSDTWARVNQSAMRETLDEHKQRADALVEKAVLQSPIGEKVVDCALLLRWISQEADKGRRLLAIDPITMMETGDKCWIDQMNFIRGARGLVDRKQISLLLVTHPRSTQSGNGGSLNLENIAGSTAFQRFTDTVFWLQAHDNECGNFTNAFENGRQVQENYNRTIHILKARLGAGSGKKVAYKMEAETLRHIERGFIES